MMLRPGKVSKRGRALSMALAAVSAIAVAAMMRRFVGAAPPPAFTAPPSGAGALVGITPRRMLPVATTDLVAVAPMLDPGDAASVRRDHLSLTGPAPSFGSEREPAVAMYNKKSGRKDKSEGFTNRKKFRVCSMLATRSDKKRQEDHRPALEAGEESELVPWRLRKPEDEASAQDTVSPDRRPVSGEDASEKLL
eukprot:CAMPEP_0117500368 /NCGR_PEP_ID=MMETSP0784-20121206/22740_1 /TAXON_ID=39447 /ORGANISM="" /LENGTH=193 /DNA_ID=CAMNT_0005295575 /DNA_START=69 /DNA_END=649 /DNA_ORIENTATION=-